MTQRTRARAEGGGSLTGDIPILVSVIAHPDDEAVGLAICAGLQRAGVFVRYGEWTRSDAAVVVVLSPAILAAGLSLPSMSEIPDARLVPVLAAQVDDHAVPADLASLNWIHWSADDPRSALELVVEACSTDLHSYRVAQALVARAEGWDLAGRQAADLISNRRQLHDSVDALRHLRGDTSFPLLGEYMAASRIATRTQTRRAISRGIFRAFFAIGIAIGAVSVLDWIGYAQDRSKLELVASTPIADGLPAVNAVKLAALIVVMTGHGDTPPESTVDKLIGMLSDPWAHARFQVSPDGMPINDTAVDDDGFVRWIDGGGVLWGSDADRTRTSRYERILDSPGYYLSTSDGAEVVVVADEHRVVVVRAGERSELSLTDPVHGVDVSGNGTHLVVRVADGVRIFDLGEDVISGGEKHDGVLATAFVEGDVRMLRRSDDGVLELSSMVGDVPLRTFPDVSGPLSTAAMGGDGWVVVHGADGQLWAAADGAEIAPTGVRVPDLLASMTITSRNELLYTPVGYHTRVFDLIRGIPLAETCREDTAQDLTLSPDGRWLVCGYVSDFALWNLDEIRPVAGPDGAGQQQNQIVGGPLAARITMAGQLEVTQNGAAHLWDLSGADTRTGGLTASTPTALRLVGHLSAVAVTATSDAVAVGTTAGDVVVADVHDDGSLRSTARWTAPDQSPVVNIALTGGRATITTTTATWEVPFCQGCSENLGALVAAVTERQLACYPEDIGVPIPARILTELGVSICEDG